MLLNAAPQVPGHLPSAPANGAVLGAPPLPDDFISAAGGLHPAEVGAKPLLCRHIATHGTVLADTAEAVHETGDLLQAGLEITRFAAPADVVRHGMHQPARLGSGGYDRTRALVQASAEGSSSESLTPHLLPKPGAQDPPGTPDKQTALCPTPCTFWFEEYQRCGQHQYR
jgi:hypothetical protein